MTAPVAQEFSAPSGISERFDELYRSMFQSLVRFARRRLPRSCDPEDIVQESFLKVMERIDPVVIESAPSYLTTVVKNGVTAELRSRAAQERASSRIFEPEKPDPLSRIEERELSDAVNKLSSELPVRQRRFIELYAIGMTPAEIARVESKNGRILSANQVSCALLRATARLRQLLQRGGFAFVWGMGDALRWVRLRWTRVQDTAAAHEASVRLASLILASAMGVGISSLDLVTEEPSSEGKQRSLAVSTDASESRIKADSVIAKHRETSRDARVIVSSNASVGSVETGVRLGEEGDEQAPGLISQILDLAENPEKLNPIQCGGLPVCEE